MANKIQAKKFPVTLAVTRGEPDPPLVATR
jgi:hypothetical protein